MARLRNRHLISATKCRVQLAQNPHIPCGPSRKHHFEAPERDVFDLLRSRVTFRYESAPPIEKGVVASAQVCRELPRLVGGFLHPIRCVITSPPYLDVTNFEEDQWLRLWFLRGQPRPTYRVISKDDRHERPEPYWDLIADMWRVLGRILAKNADIVIRIGGKNFNTQDMGQRLQATSGFSKRKAELVESETSEIKRRQTDSFRPGSRGCLVESDFHFRLKWWPHVPKSWIDGYSSPSAAHARVNCLRGATRRLRLN